VTVIEADVAIIETDREEVRAPRVLIATGTGAGPVCAALGTHLAVLPQVLTWFPIADPGRYQGYQHQVFIRSSRDARFYGFPSTDGWTAKVAASVYLDEVSSTARPLTWDPRHLDTVQSWVGTFLTGLVPRPVKMVVCADYALGDLLAEAGSQVRGNCLVSLGTSTVPLPVVITHGSAPGPVLAITAGIHGGEYVPMVAVRQFVRDLDPALMRGTIVACLQSSPVAFQTASSMSGRARWLIASTCHGSSWTGWRDPPPAPPHWPGSRPSGARDRTAGTGGGPRCGTRQALLLDVKEALVDEFVDAEGA
jgi:Succinylglutamate desuccinylase / Aspartoacylase family